MFDEEQEEVIKVLNKSIKTKRRGAFYITFYGFRFYCLDKINFRLSFCFLGKKFNFLRNKNEKNVRLLDFTTSVSIA